MGFGTSKIGKTGFKKALQIAAPKSGETTRLECRVLPPIKSCIATGAWFKFHKQHWGYLSRSKDDPTKDFPTPFVCVEVFDFKNRRVIFECPECNLINSNWEALEDRKRDLKAEGKSDEQIHEAVKDQFESNRSHNLEKRYYLNVKLTDDTFTTIKVPKEAMDALNEVFEKLGSKYSIPDPTDVDNGVWVCFTRKGSGFKDSKYGCELVVEDKMLEGRRYETIKSAPLTEDDFNKAMESCFDLNDPGLRTLSVDRIKMLVESSGDPVEVAAIFDTSEKVNATPTVTDKVKVMSPAKAAAKTQVQVEKAEAAVSASVPVSAKPVVVVPTTKVQSPDPATMSEEDFRREFERRFGPSSK